MAVTGTASDGTPACDSCLIITLTPCPGADAHCVEGHHCIWQGADCAAENSGYVHPSKCCHCQAPIQTASY
jgi:hypothetical protein